MSVILRERLVERVEGYAARNPEASRAEVLGRFLIDPDENSEESALVESVLDGDRGTPRGAADEAEVRA